MERAFQSLLLAWAGRAGYLRGDCEVPDGRDLDDDAGGGVWLHAHAIVGGLVLAHRIAPTRRGDPVDGWRVGG